MSNLTKAVKSIKLNKGGDLLVTPKIEQFMRDNPEGVIWDREGFELFETITKATFGGNSDRSGRFGASGRGTCQRKQLFTYMGMPDQKMIDVDQQILFSDGKWRHMRWQMLLMQAGVVTHVEYPLSMPKYRLTSSVDALNSIDCWLFELKGDRHQPRTLDMDDPIFEKHNLQIHTMMLMTGWDLASYLVEDKSSQQFRELVIRRDPKIIRTVKEELEELNEHVEQRTLPEVLPACREKAGPYRQCPYGPKCLERSKSGDYWPDVPGDWDS